MQVMMFATSLVLKFAHTSVHVHADGGHVVSLAVLPVRTRSTSSVLVLA